MSDGSAERLRLGKEVEGLRRALASRPMIDMALGVLMAAYRCTPAEAWQILVDASQRTNVKLHEIAERIADSAHGPAPSRPVREALQAAATRHTATRPRSGPSTSTSTAKAHP
ncbi:ANTAR domain-containing protein [Streptomyces sp. NPDC091272]|uniref:ANTAR domain-containing protein n=1 Tax=Streptomyces sp. NPDC091272 TaxID=3365981 RepID=UPI0037F9970D